MYVYALHYFLVPYWWMQRLCHQKLFMQIAVSTWLRASKHTHIVRLSAIVFYIYTATHAPNGFLQLWPSFKLRRSPLLHWIAVDYHGFIDSLHQAFFSDPLKTEARRFPFQRTHARFGCHWGSAGHSRLRNHVSEKFEITCRFGIAWKRVSKTANDVSSRARRW